MDNLIRRVGFCGPVSEVLGGVSVNIQNCVCSYWCCRSVVSAHCHFFVVETNKLIARSVDCADKVSKGNLYCAVACGVKSGVVFHICCIESDNASSDLKACAANLNFLNLCCAVASSYVVKVEFHCILICNCGCSDCDIRFNNICIDVKSAVSVSVIVRTKCLAIHLDCD